jgi:hypothetical protein
MDSASHRILESLKQVCSQRIDYYWELLATAAGDQKAMKRTVEGLETQNLKLETEVTISPVMAEERVLALSVSNPTKLYQLFSNWQLMYDRQEISRDDACLTRAWGQAKRYFTPEQCNFESTPWSWHEEFTPFSGNGRILSRRPLKEKHLTSQDLHAATQHGAGVLRALRTQNVELEASAFFHYSNQISSIDPYVLAVLIELSRRTDFDTEIWVEKFLEIFPTVTEPLYLTPSIYCLLNPEWCVP